VAGTLANGQPYANVWHIDIGEATLTQEVADVIAGELEEAYDDLSAHFEQNFDLPNVVVTDLREEFGAEFVSTNNWPLNVTNSGVLLPTGTSLMLRWFGDGRGPQSRGRTYLGSFTEGDNDGGAVPGSSLVSAANDFVESILDSSLTYVIVSRYLHNELREEALATPITSGNVADGWRTQRRRMS